MIVLGEDGCACSTFEWKAVVAEREKGLWVRSRVPRKQERPMATRHPVICAKGVMKTPGMLNTRLAPCCSCFPPATSPSPSHYHPAYIHILPNAESKESHKKRKRAAAQEQGQPNRYKNSQESCGSPSPGQRSVRGS